MIRAGRRAAVANIASLIVAGASVFPACDIEGVTPKCSDAGECFTPPGTPDPGTGATGGTGGATGGSGGDGGDTGGTGGSGGSTTTGGTGGTGAAAGAGGRGGSSGSAGNAGAGGSGGSAGATGGAAGSMAGAGGAAGTTDGGPLDVRNDIADPRDMGNIDGVTLDTGLQLDVRVDGITGMDVGPD